ncbi:MAG: hypothetical protein KFF73_15620 [Cyclobacteriaceae bacterium]|nr:hypothetical protein [Cyclobacteriaceae bacterium]
MMKTIILLPLLFILIATGCYVETDVYIPANPVTGNYEVDEWSESLRIQTYYEIYVYRDRYDPNIIFIRNFYDVGIEVLAEVIGSRIRIPLQVVGHYEVYGSGSYFAGELTIDYSVRDIYNPSGFTDFCNAFCLRY